MKKEAVFALLLVVILIWGGFWAGRHFPIHQYERLASPDVGYARYLFIDTTTGKICNSMKLFDERAVEAAKKANLVDQAVTGQGKSSFDDLLAKKDSTTPDRLSYIPACGQE